MVWDMLPGVQDAVEAFDDRLGGRRESAFIDCLAGWLIDVTIRWSDIRTYLQRRAAFALVVLFRPSFLHAFRRRVAGKCGLVVDGAETGEYFGCHFV